MVEAATHAVVPDDRNATILVGMRDGQTLEFSLVPKEKAVVSVFDSAFHLGDGIWEGIRVRKGVVQFAKDHINRLFESAKAMYMDLQISKSGLLELIHQSVDANNMQDSEDVHIRLIISRGVKNTPHQNPLSTVGAPLIVIIPEYKRPDPSINERGLRLMTVHVRRGTPDVKDESEWNHISKATDIQACIQANAMGADEALMLDKDGFVKTCNSTNFMIIREGTGEHEGQLVVWSPTRRFQMQGITRRHTLEVCRRAGIPVIETDFTLTETYGASEAFCTGTFPSQIPVINIDGRVIGHGRAPGPLTAHIQSLYAAFVAADVARGRDAVMDEVKDSELSWTERKGNKGWIESLKKGGDGAVMVNGSGKVNGRS